jgi:uncharacterized protein YndB with AHSA1/START domain
MQKHALSHCLCKICFLFRVNISGRAAARRAPGRDQRALEGSSQREDGTKTNTATETRSVVVEREIPYPPEKLWRALTQPHLIKEWLMKSDFKPLVGHRFNLRGDWGGVLDCEVLAIEPNKTLSYRWDFKERGDLYAHPNAHRHSPAHGADVPQHVEGATRRMRAGS